MIKEYFTDGLIGLAILLSLFRTDLVSINNLIDYPEVQDVILGQTAAYLPVNFHNYRNSPVFNNRKHIDFDNEAFSAWYQNVQNLPRFRVRRDNEIEAFLVNAPPATPSFITGEHFQTETTDHTSTDGNEVPELSSPTLPLEGANSFTDSALFDSSGIASSSSNQTQESDNQSAPPDVTVLYSCPFPGCNLTKEDLDLIEVLWRQDVDLGVGKEVFDQSLRLELEKERELEHLKQQEKQKAQAVAREKEERQRQEQANKWLQKNFMRDGETGEWVPLQNETANTSLFNTTTTDVGLGDSGTDEFSSLEAALDYISSSVDLDVLKELEANQQAPDLSVNGFTDSFLDQTPPQEFHDTQPTVVEPVPNQQMYLEHQDSLEENWNGLVSYLNMASSSNATTLDPGSMGNSLVRNGLMMTPEEHLNSAMTLNSDLNAMTSELDGQGELLLQNVTLPSLMTPDMNATNDFSSLSPVVNNSQPSVGVDTTPIDWDFDDLSFFNNLTTGNADLTNASVVDDLDLDGVGNIFLNMEPDAGMVKDNDHNIVDELSQSVGSMGNSTPNQDLSDVFDGLEGAIGGSDYTSGNVDLNGPFRKMSRLSESSGDSGYAYQAGYSSSSASSSYAGSPAGSNHSLQNNSAASNDTELDPKGSHILLAQGHVAHNHTYNTPPGQTPREVKKYAPKEPSRKGPQSRDQRRADELKIPFTLAEIIESPVDTFNEMLTKYQLTEPQLTLIRDIRRRGKNKVAAQNCRKRKVGAIVSLADDTLDLQKTRDRLIAERAQMERDTRRMKEKFGQLYTHIFQSLRDEHGQPYDPNMYSLQQSSDGNVFLVPRNVTGKVSSGGSANSSTSSSPNSSSNSGMSRKRKAFEQ